MLLCALCFGAACVLIGKVTAECMLSQDQRTRRNGRAALQRQPSVFSNYVERESSLMMLGTGFKGVIDTPNKSYRNRIRLWHGWGQLTPVGEDRFFRHAKAERLGKWLIREKRVLGEHGVDGRCIADPFLLFSDIISHEYGNEFGHYQNILGRGATDVLWRKGKIHLNAPVDIHQWPRDRYIGSDPRTISQFKLSGGGIASAFCSIGRFFEGLALHLDHLQSAIGESSINRGCNEGSPCRNRQDHLHGIVLMAIGSMLSFALFVGLYRGNSPGYSGLALLGCFLCIAYGAYLFSAHLAKSVQLRAQHSGKGFYSLKFAWPHRLFQRIMNADEARIPRGPAFPQCKS